MNNDEYIDLLLEDPNYDIRSDGTIWSKMRGYWKQIGSFDYHKGYTRIRYYRYGRVYLRVNRIVYRKVYR